MQQTEEIKNFIYQLTKLTKAKLENKTKARCQVGNEAMETKVTNMLRGKERKEEKKERTERIDMQSSIEVDEDLYTLKINCKGKITSRKNKGINRKKYV